MKKHRFLLSNLHINLFFLLFFSLNQPKAQCPEGSVILLTQNDVIAFANNFSNCNTLPSNLIIGNSPASEPFIKNLEQLKNITAINGYLYIQDTKILESLKGLENLTDISGDLFIYENDSLKNVNELQNIKTIEGNLLISENKTLINIDGLTNSSFGGHINILENDSLENIDGLQNIENVNGNLNIIKNYYLNSIEGLRNIRTVDGDLGIQFAFEVNSLMSLQNITEVGGDLIIKNSRSLKNLDGLDNIKSIGKNLVIYYNIGLLNLEGLQSLTTIEGNLTISQNDSLQSLDALRNVRTFNGQQLIIERNRFLEVCSVSAICNFLSNQEAEFSIERNAVGCNNAEEILEKCIVDITEFNSSLVSIFPNPSSGIFNIIVDKPLVNKASFSLYDAQGKQIIIPKPLSTINEHLNFVDFSSLSNGIYYINLHLEDRLLQKKLIIVK